MKILAFCRVLWYNICMENREMQTSNTEEMVTISRAEYERFQEQEQAQTITSLTLQNEWLLEQLKLSKKKLFGRSSEQAEQMVMDQLSLTYNELEAYVFGTKAATGKQIAVKAHERKRQSGNVLDVVPEGTPTEVVEHRLSEKELTCSACGSKMVEIGKEVRRSLMMKPAEFWVREDIYYTYACKNCEQETGEANIVKTAKEPALLPGSFASAEAVAYLAAQKFVMYSPLYRLSTSQHARRSTRRISCGISPAGCTQMDTRATTNCLKISVWWAVGHMPGENLMRRCKRCPRRCRRTLRQRLANAIAPDFSSWSRRLRS